ncbi:hypothetical protein LTR85_010714 [Meristemomyces frigidus]|nr:hypothetical protein LTR85_010714 [Meristemomyces frigidus]
MVRYEVFNERPLIPTIAQYCAQDVALLQGLYDVYEAKLRPAGQKLWQVEVAKATRERVKLSQSAAYDPHGGNRARGPWSEDYIEQATDAWNEAVLEDALMPDEDVNQGWDNDGFDEDDYQDTIKDRDFWEEDMYMRGSPF